MIFEPSSSAYFESLSSVIITIKLNKLYQYNLGIDDDLSKPPLERSYKANYIQHYPKAIDGNPLDKEAVRMVGIDYLNLRAGLNSTKL